MACVAGSTPHCGCTWWSSRGPGVSNILVVPLQLRLFIHHWLPGLSLGSPSLPHGVRPQQILSMTPSILGVSGTSEAKPLVAAPSFSLLLFIMALLCGFHEAQTSSHLGDSYMLPSLAARLRCSPGVFWTTASVRDS